jgi:hypothetical protein
MSYRAYLTESALYENNGLAVPVYFPASDEFFKIIGTNPILAPKAAHELLIIVVVIVINARVS